MKINTDILTADDEFESLFCAPPATTQVPVSAPVGAGGLHVEQCSKCQGTGHYGRFGTCYTCKGKGSKSFVASAATRSANRAKSAVRTQRALGDNFAAFKLAFPAEDAYLAATCASNEFCASLYAAVGKYGSLTPKQLAAATAGAARSAQSAIERATGAVARADAAPQVSVDALLASFAAATASGLKRPKIRLAGVELSLAPVGGKNPGAVYATAPGGEYLGKVAGGKFHASRECGPEAQAAVVAALIDPLAQAVAYGRLTGSCSCCGRELTDPVSVERGIGPICAEKFGW